MRWTKKRILFLALHFIFVAIVPLVLISVRYSNLGNSVEEHTFRISATGLMLALIVCYFIKKLFVDKRLADAKAQSNVMLADLRTKQDKDEIMALEREIRKLRMLDAIVGSIMPVLLFILALVVFRALENGIILLTGTLGFILLSYITAMVFNILYVREIRGRGGK